MGRLLPEEYVEQAYLFRALNQRIETAEPVQDILKHVRDEILATTKLPMAIDYMLAELNHVGIMSTAMRRLPHYFAPFQAFLIEAAESEHGRFDIRQALTILEAEARIRQAFSSPSTLFFMQFETVCRNHLSYDQGLAAMSGDPFFEPDWQKWILQIRHRIGIVELADLVYVHSEYYLQRESAHRLEWQTDSEPMPEPVLFNEKEGRIALANRRKEPLYFFAALQRQLNYPAIPKPKRTESVDAVLRKTHRQIEKLETRVKLLEDEQRQRGIDLSQFMSPPAPGNID
mgnify:CR=1 FL=1